MPELLTEADQLLAYYSSPEETEPATLPAILALAALVEATLAAAAPGYRLEYREPDVPCDTPPGQINVAIYVIDATIKDAEQIRARLQTGWEAGQANLLLTAAGLQIPAQSFSERVGTLLINQPSS